MTHPPLAYVHVDVFSRRAFSGNSLPVFLDAGGLSAMQMLRITQELRHFEATFLQPTAQAGVYRARIFDLFEELPFAGHPLIGAAAALHAEQATPGNCSWWFDLSGRLVEVTTEATEAGFFGWLDQGAPSFLGEVGAREAVADAFSLSPVDLAPHLPLEVVSTGLRYLVVPVQGDALTRARIARDISSLLQAHGAQFAVVLDNVAGEVRHWNNDGLMEDIATGSAAGIIGAYRVKHGLSAPHETFTLHQGRFLDRPSALRVRVDGEPGSIERVLVGGDVAVVGRGRLEILPEIAA